MTDIVLESDGTAELNPIRFAGLKLTPSVPIGGVGDTEEVSETISEPVPPDTHVAVAMLIMVVPAEARKLPCVDDRVRPKLNKSMTCSE